MLWADALLDPGVEHSRPQTPFTPLGLCLHSTADAGATAQQIRDYFNSHNGASSHFVVDWTEALWDPGHAEVAWGAGVTANERFLHLEACEPTNGPAGFGQFHACYTRWIAAAADVLEAYKWPCDDAHVWSHARVSSVWRETDHRDPLPWLARWGKTWDDVLQDLGAALLKDPEV